MTSRRAVTDVLERLAFAAELLDAPGARSYGAAAWAIRSLEGDLAAMRESGELAQVKGVGPSILEVVDAVLSGGAPEALARFEAQIPEGLFRVRRIKGLGAKKVKALWKELSITTLGELEYACRENRLLSLKGFGEKTQEKVLREIARLRADEGLLRRDQARALLAPYVVALAEHPGVSRARAVGDERRGRELVRGLELLVAGDDVDAALEATAGLRPTDPPPVVYRASEETFGAVSLWRSSSRAHSEALAQRAADRGLVLDELGFHREDGSVVACPEEEDVYRALSLVPTPPERREPGVPLVERGRVAPRLVTRADLRGALHNHTLASDGSATLEQMRAAAEARGLAYLGISEHSEAAFYARGLSAERLLAQVSEIDALNGPGGGCVLLTGVESDILADGSLDYAAEVLARLELVVASVHRRHGQDAAQMTARMVAAAQNPWTAVVGHPTGRLLLGRAPSEYDMEAFLDACAENGCAVELNANPQRLDLNERHLAMARERGLLVSIAADAHAVEELDNLDYGVTIARRAGLTAKDVLNARTLDELRAWLAARRAKAGPEAESTLS